MDTCHDDDNDQGFMLHEQCPSCGHTHIWDANWVQQGDPVVTIIGLWPIEERTLTETDPRYLSRCYYNTACHNGRFNLQIIEHPGQARIPPGIPLVSLEEPTNKNDILLQDYNHPLSCTYVLGNSKYQRPSEHFDVDEIVSIRTEAFVPGLCFYGAQVAPLIWYDRMIKGLGREEYYHGIESG